MVSQLFLLHHFISKNLKWSLVKQWQVYWTFTVLIIKEPSIKSKGPNLGCRKFWNPDFWFKVVVIIPSTWSICLYMNHYITNSWYLRLIALDRCFWYGHNTTPLSWPSLSKVSCFPWVLGVSSTFWKLTALI